MASSKEGRSSKFYVFGVGALVIVIGGLVCATVATLLLVPIFYTLLRKNAPALHTLDQRFAAEAAGASKEALGHG